MKCSVKSNNLVCFHLCSRAGDQCSESKTSPVDSDHLYLVDMAGQRQVKVAGWTVAEWSLSRQCPATSGWGRTSWQSAGSHPGVSTAERPS